MAAVPTKVLVLGPNAPTVIEIDDVDLFHSAIRPIARRVGLQDESVELPETVTESTVNLATEASTTSPIDRQAAQGALDEILISSQAAADWHSRRAALFGGLYLALGIPAAALAAIAGAVALASVAGRVPAAIIALISAAIGGAATFLNSGSQRRYHQEMSSEWYMIAAEAKLHKLVDLGRPEWIAENFSEVLRGLLGRQAQLLQGKPAVVVSQPVASPPGGSR